MAWKDLGRVKGNDGVEGESVKYTVDGDRVGFKSSNSTEDYEYTPHLTGPQGVSLEFDTSIDGKIGVKKDSDEEFTYVDIGQHVLDHTEIRVVDSLPSTGESNVIYLRSKASTGSVDDSEVFAPIYLRVRTDEDSTEDTESEDTTLENEDE